MDKRYATRLRSYERMLEGIILVPLRKYYRASIDQAKSGDIGSVKDPSFKREFTNYMLKVAITEAEIEYANQFAYRESRTMVASRSKSMPNDILKGILEALERPISIQYTLVVDGIINSTERSILAVLEEYGDDEDDLSEELEFRYKKKLKPWAYSSAVTEMGTVVNASRYLAARDYYESQELEAEKKYLTQDDEKVRHSHEILNGVVTGIDSDFIFEMRGGGVEFALYPCSSQLSLPNKIRCRCMVVYAEKGIMSS